MNSSPKRIINAVKHTLYSEAKQNTHYHTISRAKPPYLIEAARGSDFVGFRSEAELFPCYSSSRGWASSWKTQCKVTAVQSPLGGQTVPIREINLLTLTRFWHNGLSQEALDLFWTHKMWTAPQSICKKTLEHFLQAQSKLPSLF